MSTGLPLRIQVLKGQGGERNYSGQLKLEAMPRLSACVAGPQASITVDLRLERDRRGRCQAQPRINVSLQLQCQRCMDAMQWSAKLSNQLQLLVAVEQDEQQQQISDDATDSFLLDEGYLDVAALVEDEILLALPIAPLHDVDSECGKQALNRQAQREDTHKPFAALSALKPKH